MFRNRNYIVTGDTARTYRDVTSHFEVWEYVLPSISQIGYYYLPVSLAQSSCL